MKFDSIKAKIADKVPKQNVSDTTYITALDIGTEFVKVLIAKNTDEGIEIIGVGRKRQRLSDMHSGAISDIAGVVDTCDQALQDAEDMTDESVDSRNAAIGIAGELVYGATTTLTYKRPDSSKEIAIPELTSIMQKVQDRAFARAQAQLSWESGKKDIEIRQVNSALVSLMIDGYKVNNPVGFQGTDMSFQLYSAFAPMVHISALEKTADELDLQLVAITAEPFAVARAVTPNEANTTFSAIMIDVGGGTTDIAVVNEGGVQGTRMFGIGGRSFTHTIATELDVDFEKAEKLKLSLAQQATGPDAKKLQNAIASTLDVWLSGIQVALEDFDTVDHLPAKILLCGGGSSLKPLVRALQNDPWWKELPFTKQPVIHHIAPEEVFGVRDSTKKVTDHTFVTAMGLLVAARDTLDTSGDDDKKMTDRLNKLLQI